MEKKSKQVCGKQYPHRIFAALPLIFRITIFKNTSDSIHPSLFSYRVSRIC